MKQVYIFDTTLHNVYLFVLFVLLCYIQYATSLG